MAEQRVTGQLTEETLDELEKFARAAGNLLGIGLVAELRVSLAELARYKAATAEAHRIMEAAIVRGGYRPGEAERVAELLGIPLEN